VSVPADKLKSLIKGATDKWRKQRQAEERSARARLRRSTWFRRRPTTIKEAAWRVMERAYRSASGSLRQANPRQIFYKARPLILDITGKDYLDSKYFTQTLLVDFINETGVDWDILWDDRGHFREPHTERVIGVGTLAVRHYLASCRTPKVEEAAIVSALVTTQGPQGRYGAALFIEKEGFQGILEASGIAEKFDIAIMSTKGMSVSAARQLIDGLAAKRVRILVLRDFDVAGFSIAKTFVTSGRRHVFRHRVDWVDLGLRLADVEAEELESEPFQLPDTGRGMAALKSRLEINGATQEEIAFLMEGERVELNAMDSDQLVAFVERKLEEHGVEKVVPDGETLEAVYAAMMRSARAKKALKGELEGINAEPIESLADLAERVAAKLEEEPETTWDGAVRQIAEDDEDDEDA
jgi:hypothetical protein